MSIFALALFLTLIGSTEARSFEANETLNEGLLERQIVYFITGAPVDVQPAEITDSASILKNYLTTYFPRAELTVIHNSLWSKVCEDIKAVKAQANAPVKVILIGHSYGAQAGVTIAQCLLETKIKVDRLITIDMIQRPFDVPAEEIPDNVVTNNGFYETSDPLLQGARNNARTDRTEQGITNTEIKVPGAVSPHFEIVRKVFEEGIVEALVAEELK